MKEKNYAVIMAGGSGTRFWPLSRSRRPKQLLKILGQKSLIRQTVERILPLFKRENILVVTVADHYPAIRRELPFLPGKNFLVEPRRNNTAPCIGLAAAEIERREPQAIMAALPADHWISDVKSFQKTIRAALQLAKKHDLLLTMGIKPGYPETGYGYILKGETIEGSCPATYRARDFKEKPDLERAKEWIELGALWNSGVFVWKVSTILEMLRRFAPAIAAGLDRIKEALQGKRLGSSSPKIQATLRREYKKMPNISIDHAVLEKAGAEGKVMSLEANFGWSDVGSWAALPRLLPRDREGIAGVGRWLAFKSKDCLIYSPDRLVALLGIHDAVVVDTPDALLVADIRRAQEVRDLVEELGRRGYRRYVIR